MNGKTFFLLFSSLICFTHPSNCQALPKDPYVAAGSAEFTQVDPHSIEIRPSDQAIINYSKFDIGKQEKVRFIQNSSSSCVLNRVQGQDPSQILGSLESNGKVFLVNPNGIYFGSESKVNVGSLIASTLDIADEDFLSEKYRFTLGKDALIKSEGLLQSLEGSIVLMAPQIQNLGSIEAKAGTVLLASGEYVTLDFIGDGLVQFSVEGSLKEAMIEHLGEVKGSNVSVKLPVAKKAIQEVVNLEGLEEGDIFIEENGVIKFAANSSVISQNVLLESANVSIEGRIDASSLTDKGGEVHLLGRNISLQGAQIDVSGQLGGGEVLIGGEYQGKGTTPYASKVVMDETSQIFANALETGDGGLVVLWSQNQTLFNGRIEAKGGLLEGDGGFVETSSRDALGSEKGYVNTEAPKGKIGEWLLDPYSISIFGFDTTCSGSPNYGNCSDNKSCGIRDTSINNSTATVTITADSITMSGVSINMGTAGAGLNLNGCSSSSTFFMVGTIQTNAGDVIFNNIALDVFDKQKIITNGGVVTIPSLICTYVNAGLHIQAGDSVVTVTAQPTSLSSYLLNSVVVDSASAVYSNGIVTQGGTGFVMPTNIPFYPQSSSITIDTSKGSGLVTLGTISDSTKDIIINAGGGAVSLASTTNVKTLQIVSAGSVAFSNITVASGGISIPAAANLLASSTLTSNGGDIIFESTLTGEQSLNLVAGGGDVFLKNDVSIGSLDVTSAHSISFTNIMTSQGDIDIPVSATLLGGSFLSSAGNITFGTTITGSDAFSLDAVGLISFGGSFSVGSLDIRTAGSGVNVSNVTTSGLLNITPFVVLSGNPTMTSTNGNIVFGNAIKGASEGSQSLNLIATNGSIQVVGAIGDPALNSLDVQAGLGFTFSSITTSGSSPFINIESPVVLTGPASVTSGGGSITLGTVSGEQNLTLDAASGTVFVGSMGDTALGLTPLKNISITGGLVTLGGTAITTKVSPDGALTIQNSNTLTISAGALSLSGAFTQTGAGVSLGNSITAGTINVAAPITLIGSSTLTSFGSLTLSSTVDGNQNFTLSSIGSFNIQDLGSTIALGETSLTGYAGSYLKNITTDSQSITISAPTITLGGGGVVTIDSTNGSSNGASIQIIGAINADTSEGLTLNATGVDGAGIITVKGPIGDAAGLSSFTISGDPSIANSEVHLGDSAIPTDVKNVIATSIVINPLLILDSSVSMTGSNIQVLGNATVLSRGVQELAMTSTGGITTTNLGTNESPLGSLTLTAASSSFIKNIITGGAISLSAPSFTLSPVSGNLIYIDSSSGGYFAAGAITVSGSIQATTSGVESLQIRAIGQNAAGLITLKGPIGNNSLPLGLLTILGDSSLYASQLILGDSSLSSMSITAEGPIDMSALYGIKLVNDTTVTTTNNVINMANAEINGDGTGGQTLTLSAGTSIIDLGAAGFNVPVGVVQITADLFHLSGIRTKGAPIHIDAVTNLKIESVTLDTTNNAEIPNGADIFFASTVDSAKNLSITAGNAGDITFSSDVGGIDPLAALTIISGSDVVSKNIKTIGNLTIAPHITLSDTLNVFSSSSEGTIALGDIDGISSGPHSLTVNTSGAVALGVIGARTPLLDVKVPTGTSATIHSIQVNGVIDIDIPLILAASSTLHTPESITCRWINGNTNGGESLTIISAGDVFFKENIGDPKNGNPIGNLDVTGSSILLQGKLITTAGTQTYHSPVTVLQDMRFNSLRNITFESTVDPESGAPSMAVYPGSGTLTFADSVGDAPFGNIVVYNAGSFSAQDVFANSLVVSGGLPTIFLNGNITLSGRGIFIIDGGPIYFGGSIDLNRVWFRSYGDMSNLGSPQPINVSEYELPDLQYLNAVKGVIGSESSPIEINAKKILLIGADSRADFIGNPMQDRIKPIPSNPPCIVTFNGVTILDCLATDVDVQKLFNSISKDLFYVPGLYSSWDNLSNPEYFEEEPWNLGLNPRDSIKINWVKTGLKTLRNTLVGLPDLNELKKIEHLTLMKENAESGLITLNEFIEEFTEAKEILSNFSIEDATLLENENQEKAPLTKISVEVIAPPGLKTKPEEECVDWEFSVLFGQDQILLDLLLE